MARTQTLVQLTDELVARLDERAASEGRSRSELIRAAIDRFLASEGEADIDRAIVEGYARIPPARDSSVGEIARRSIESEPW